MENEKWLIDVEKVYEKACVGCIRHGENPGDCYHTEPCERLIFAFTTAPTVDAVEVVRCKECRWVRPSINEETGKKEGLWCPALEEVKPDDFCSYGERKDENETA